jgi:hypothetical protein
MLIKIHVFVIYRNVMRREIMCGGIFVSGCIHKDFKRRSQGRSGIA